MVHQKTLTFFGIEVPDSLQGSLTELGHDVCTLADLQVRLARADLAEAVEEARVPAIGLVIGLAVLVSCVPIALVGVAEGVVFAGWLPRFGAYLAVAGGFALVSGLVSWLCLRSVRKSGRAFERSREELRRNIDWVTRVISEGGSLRLRQPMAWTRSR
ncbi:phage holin family protein [Tautonia sociabilis]|uniref:Phage holin family protein n=1 Tax=Tautonia sociabilis TaxID=2080755 RepID=A0A432MEJ8_9BACT|nr:phage holin family protein [Tautonia sociabilis]RUL83900.1 phage holin family protein [Tautonia sociabilis]